MGVVSIKPKHVKEILNLLSVLDRKTKEAEVLVFETEGAPYGAVNVTIFKDRTLDMGKVLVTTLIPYHTLEGDLSAVFPAKAFKEIAGEANMGEPTVDSLKKAINALEDLIISVDHQMDEEGGISKDDLRDIVDDVSDRTGLWYT